MKCLDVCISSKESHPEFAAHSINLCLSEHNNIKVINSQSLFTQISEDEMGTNPPPVEISHKIPGRRVCLSYLIPVSQQHMQPFVAHRVHDSLLPNVSISNSETIHALEVSFFY